MKTILAITIVIFSLYQTSLAQFYYGPPVTCGNLNNPPIVLPQADGAPFWPCVSIPAPPCGTEIICNNPNSTGTFGNFEDLTTASTNPTPPWIRNFSGFYIVRDFANNNTTIDATTDRPWGRPLTHDNSPDVVKRTTGNNFQLNNSGNLNQQLFSCSIQSQVPYPMSNGNFGDQYLALQANNFPNYNAPHKREAIAIPLNQTIPAGTTVSITFDARFNIASLLNDGNGNLACDAIMQFTDLCSSDDFRNPPGFPPLPQSKTLPNHSWAESGVINNPNIWSTYQVNHTFNQDSDILIAQLELLAAAGRVPLCTGVYIDNIKVVIDEIPISISLLPCTSASPATLMATPQGTGTFQYSWASSASTGSMNGGNSNVLNPVVGPAQYTVTVTQGSCTGIATGTIPNPTPPTITWNTTNSDCAGNCNGSITLGSISGGNPPYTYQLNAGIPTSNPNWTNLCPGSYVIIVIDDCGNRFQDFEVDIEVDGYCWQQTSFNPNSQDQAYDIANDIHGNVYVTGNYLNSTNFDCGTGVTNSPIAVNSNSNSTHMFLTSYDRCGVPLWSAYSKTQVSGDVSEVNSRAIIVDNENGWVYVTGKIDIDQNITWVGGDGLEFAINDDPYKPIEADAYIAKFHLVTGNLIDVHYWGENPAKDIQPLGLALKEMSVYSVGSYEYLTGAGISTRPFIRKVDFSGYPTLQQYQIMIEDDAYFTDIEMNSEGTLYACGRDVNFTNNLLSFNKPGTNYPIIITGNSDGFYLAMTESTSGFAVDWLRALYNTTGDGIVEEICITDNDEIYGIGSAASGGAQNCFAFNTNNIFISAGTGNAAFYAHLPNNGTWTSNHWLNFSNITLDTEGKSIATDGTRVYVAGNVSSPGNVTFTQGAPFGGQAGAAIPGAMTTNDVFTAEILAGGGNGFGGDVLKGNTTVGSGAAYLEAICANQVFVHSAGTYNQDISFASGQVLSGNNLTASKMFALRNLITGQTMPFLKSENETVASTLNPANKTRLYPNPNTGSFTIEISSDIESECDIKIVDLSGRVFLSNQSQVLSKGPNSIEINLDGAPTGFYMLIISGNEFSETSKFSIMN